MAMTRIVGILVLALSLICVLHMTEANEVLPDEVSVCERIFEYLPSCLEFLVGDPNYSRPSERCCQHVAKINILAQHRTAGPRIICWCIEIMMKGISPTLNSFRIQALPLMCNTTLSFPISDSMDCSKVG